MGVIRTANGHQTSLLVRQHVPEFVVADHPQFINFVEKYYEFMANNTLMATANSDVYYYGADTASKILQDIMDVDRTDFDQFIEFFRRQYGYSFPQDVYPDGNRATLYKNMVDFYRAVGTEDSFKMLFRLLYNEDIEIYYPSKDILIASGGKYSKGTRVKVNYTDNLNAIKNKMLVGVTSGATATIEKVVVLPKGSDSFVSGNIANDDVTFASGVGVDPFANSEIHDTMKFVEHGTQVAFIYLTDSVGKFDYFEDVYYTEGGAANTSVASNTIILPSIKQIMMIDRFNYRSANSIISPFDGKMGNRRADSTNPPWGSANLIFGYSANGGYHGDYINYGNTGIWHTTGTGTGEIKIANIVFGASGGRVLEIGNNNVSTANGDMRQFVYSKLMGIRGEDNLYRLSIRARDLGGNSSYSVATGNRFSAGIALLDHARYILGADGYADSYDEAFWFASHKQAIDDEFYIYQTYFRGRENTRSTGNPYLATNYGSGGRTDLPIKDRYYNSAQKALDGEVRMPFNATYILPTFKVNEPANGASFSQGITQIDFISLEEMTPMQSQEGRRTGFYTDDSSLLSSSSHLYDGHYWQWHAYDIKSKQQLKDYATVVRESAHPAGMKMFGTMISESSANGAIESIENNLSDTFSPDQLNSLAGWWKADAIGPKNIEWRKWSADTTSNGDFGTIKNRIPAGATDGLSKFEPSTLDYLENYKDQTVRCLLSFEADSSPIGGSQIARVTDWHTSAGPSVTFNGGPQSGITTTQDTDQFYTNYHWPMVIEPHKKWLFSTYARTSNIITDGSADRHIVRAGFQISNTSGHLYSPISQGSYSEAADAENTWKRVSSLIDASARPETRVALHLTLPDRTKWADLGLATGNTTTDFDGFMIEEYIPELHGTSAPYTPSPFVVPGMGGSNVHTWRDYSPNKHHLHVNTHGGIFHHPQWIANAVGGMPAVRFSANTVKNNANVYPFSSIGGTVNSIALSLGDSTAFIPPTSGFQSSPVSNSEYGVLGGTLANPALPIPVSNTWTIMAVVKTNLGVNATSYDTTLNPTIFNSGYAGNRDSIAHVPNNSRGSMHLGYDVVGDVGALETTIPVNTYQVIQANTVAITTFAPHSSANTESSFRIVGVSVNAASGAGFGDLLNFHIDGRRFSNSEVNNSRSDLSLAAFDWRSQNNFVTSIGKWKPTRKAFFPFPVYPEANGIMGVGATGNLVFFVNCSNTNILPTQTEFGPLGDVQLFNSGGVDFVAPHTSTGNNTVNGSVIPLAAVSGVGSSGDLNFGIPYGDSSLSIFTPYEGITQVSQVVGTGNTDAYLMYSHTNAVARFGIAEGEVSTSAFGTHKHIIPVEWDSANNSWYAIYNATIKTPAPYTGTIGVPFVPDAANGDFIVARLRKTIGLYGITDFESFVFAANSENQSYTAGGEPGNSFVIAGLSEFRNAKREEKVLSERAYLSNTYNDIITGTADWDGDIAEVLVFNEKLSNTNIALVEGYLAHKYSLRENLKHKDDDGNGGPEVEAYRWEFANTHDGWDFYVANTMDGYTHLRHAEIEYGTSGSSIPEYVWTAGDANNYLHIASPDFDGFGSIVMVQNTTTQIDASAYDKFAVRFRTWGPARADEGRGYLTWTNTDGITGNSDAITTSQYGSGWQEDHIHDLSGEADWTGKITSLKYTFDYDESGGTRYYIDYAYISGNNHPHPYRWNAPPAIGANNSWHVNY